jgi:hypothetical protein
MNALFALITLLCGVLAAVARQAEERGPDERHGERKPERHRIVERVPEDQSHGGAECRELRQCEVHEDHLALHDVEAQVDEQRWEDQARDQGPLHHGPDHLWVDAHQLVSASAVASA